MDAMANIFPSDSTASGLTFDTFYQKAANSLIATKVASARKRRSGNVRVCMFYFCCV